MKICKKCKEIKSFDSFSKRKESKDGFQHYCKQCRGLVHKIYQQKNKKILNEYMKKYYNENDENYEKLITYQKKYKKANYERINDLKLQSKYGITLIDYLQMLEKQKRLCTICGNENILKKTDGIIILDVDYDSGSGKVRSLLCRTCSSLLIYVEDNMQKINNILLYLDKYKN